MKKFHRRFFEILIFIYFLNLTSCSKKQEMDDISIQKRYKQLYALRVCSIMEIFVEDYNKNSDYTWGINQGISNDTERDRIVINLAQLGIKNMRYTYKIPKEFIPNPEFYNIDDISDKCFITYLEFKSIPY